MSKSGIAGLMPRRRGPQRAHKCTDEILDFVEQWRADPSPEKDVSEAVQKRFGVAIHPRSLARALSRRKKKPTMTTISVEDERGSVDRLEAESMKTCARKRFGPAHTVVMVWRCFCRAA